MYHLVYVYPNTYVTGIYRVTLMWYISNQIYYEQYPGGFTVVDLDIILLPSFPPSLLPSFLPSFLPPFLSSFTHPFLPSSQVLALVQVECRRSVVYDFSLEITIVRYLQFQELCVVSMVVGNLVVG